MIGKTKNTATIAAIPIEATISTAVAGSRMLASRPMPS